MNDFDGLLASEFGLKPQGRAAPMSASKGSSNFTTRSTQNDDVRPIPNHNSDDAFADLFGPSAKSDPPFNLDAMYRGGSADFGGSKPVYDKPVYDDDGDIFDGVPGLKTSSSSKATYDDVFASMDSGVKGGSGGGRGGGAAFDDLLGGFGKAKSWSEKRSEKEEKGVGDFDDLIPGFGSSKNSSERYCWFNTLCFEEMNFA